MTPFDLEKLKVVGGLAANFFGNGLNAYMQDRTNRQNVSLQENANQQVWDMWRLQNQYNTPAAQVARLKAAGLNPAMMYQSAPMNEAAQGGSFGAPNLRAPQVQPVDPLVGAQMDLLSSQKNLLDTQAVVAEQKLPEEIKLMQENAKQVSAVIQNLQEQNKVLVQQVSNMKVEQQVELAKKAEISLNNLFNQASFSSRLSLLTSEINNLNASTSNLKAQTRLTNRQVFELLESWSYRYLGFDLANQEIQSTIDLNNANKSNLEKTGELLGLEVSKGSVLNKSYQSLFNRSHSKNWFVRNQAKAQIHILSYMNATTSTIGNTLGGSASLIKAFK